MSSIYQANHSVTPLTSFQLILTATPQHSAGDMDFVDEENNRVKFLDQGQGAELNSNIHLRDPNFCS